MKRKSYAKVDSKQLHPETTGHDLFINEKIIKSGDQDLEIAMEIISYNKKIKVTKEADGEWKWINDKKRYDYLKVLNDGNARGLADILVNMFQNDASYGIISSDFSELHLFEQKRVLENRIRLDIDTWLELAKNSQISELNVPNIGNIYGLKLGENLIPIDLPRHDYFAQKINDLVLVCNKNDNVVLEIGGGFGGLPLQLFKHANKNIKYINCDLPETLYLAYYFLKKIMKKHIKLVMDAKDIEIHNNADIFLVPNFMVDLIDIPINIVFNSHSLVEMSKKTRDEYCKQINKWGPDFFYYLNSNYVAFPNSERHLEGIESEFSIDKSKFFQLYRSISPWINGDGRSREVLFTSLKLS